MSYYNNSLLMLLLEAANEDAIKKALEKAGKSEYYDKLLAIDPQNKKGSTYVAKPATIKLTKFFLEPHSDSDDIWLNKIKDAFDSFMNLKKDPKLFKGTEGDINSKEIKDFHYFSNLVHAKKAEQTKIRPAKISTDKSEVNDKIKALGKEFDKKDIKYVDENILVVRADNVGKSKRYGSGFSTWCTARPANNYFYVYRFDHGETMYYVYFLKKDPSDKELVLHFGVNEDGDISYTDRSNEDSTQTLSWLGRKFPEIKPAIDANAFQTIPITPHEREIKELPDHIAATFFKNLAYDDKEAWLLTGERIIDVDLWNTMDSDLKNTYVYGFSDRTDDIPYEVYQVIKNEPKYLKTYFNALEERILDEDRSEDDKLTPHEMSVVVHNKMYNIIPKLHSNIITTLAALGMDKNIILKILLNKLKKTPSNDQFVIAKTIFDLFPDNQSIVDHFFTLKEKLSPGILDIMLANSPHEQNTIDKIIANANSNPIDVKVVDNMLRYSKNKQITINKLLATTGKLYPESVKYILQNCSTSQELLTVINTLIASDKQVEQFDGFFISHIMQYSPNKLDTINKLLASDKSLAENMSILAIINNCTDKNYLQDVINKLVTSNKKINSYSLTILINNSPNKQETIDKLLASNRFLEIDESVIKEMLHFTNNPQQIIDRLLSSNIPHDSIFVRHVLQYSPNPIDTITKLLASKIPLEYIINSIYYLKQQHKQPVIDYILNSMFPISSDDIYTLMTTSPSPTDTVDKLFASNRQLHLDSKSIYHILTNIKDKDFVIKKIINYPNFQLDFNSVSTMIGYAENKEDIIATLLKSNKPLNIDSLLLILYFTKDKEIKNYIVDKIITSSDQLSTSQIEKLMELNPYYQQTTIDKLINSPIQFTKSIIDMLLYYSNNPDDTKLRLKTAGKIQESTYKSYFSTLLN